MGQKKGNKINYVAARTELSGKIARECVQGIAGGINSMYNNQPSDDCYDKTENADYGESAFERGNQNL